MNKKAIFCVLILGAVLTSLMATVMSTTLPVIMETFRIPASQAQMVTSIYSLVSGITIIATAVLIKKVPTRRLFLISMGIFTIGILLCALSPNFLILLLGRIIQGAGHVIHHADSDSDGHGKSATMFGLTVAPCALLLAAFSPFTGKLYDKKGLRMLAVAGSILVLVSNGAVLFVTESTPVGILMLLMGMLGIGLSGMQMNIVTYGMKNMTGNDKTDGTAILSCLRTMGSALGTAIFVSIMAMGVSDNQYKIGDIHRTYLYMTITAAAVLVIALIFIKNTKKEDLKTL